MESGVIYNLETGEILKFVVSQSLAQQCQEGEGYLGGGHPGIDVTHYVLNGQLVERPAMPLQIGRAEIEADGFDTAIITGIPTGTKVWGLAFDAVVDDGQLEFATDTAGQYVLNFECFPYRSERVVIHAIKG